jgi:glycosyltransferase involved in cell wall biosynthesis
MRVLVVPSWYPSPDRPHIGPFFKEQAIFASHHYDVRVVVIEETRVSRRSLANLGLTLSGNSRLTVTRDTDSPIPTYRAAIDFVPPLFGKFDPAHKRALRTILDLVTADGWSPDLIHAHSVTPAGIFSDGLRELSGIPFVVTEHRHLIPLYIDYWTWQRSLVALRQARKIAAVSRFQRRMLLMNGVTQDPIVTPNLVDDARFPLTDRKRGNDEPFSIIYVGVETHLKDTATLIRAIGQLAGRYKGAFTVRLIAPTLDKADARRIKDRVSAAGLVDVVQVIDSVEPEKMPRLMQQADLLISTSLAETFGVAVGEALMTGVPVVATRSGGVEDFVSDGINGFLVDVGDADAIATKVGSVIKGETKFEPRFVRESVLDVIGSKAYVSGLEELYS